MKLNICGIPYKLIPREVMADLGQTHTGRSEVEYQAGLTPEKEQQVLLHESLHAILDEGAVLKQTVLDCTEEEEVLVARLTVALLQFLKNNPEFVRYLLGRQGLTRFNLQSLEPWLKTKGEEL